MTFAIGDEVYPGLSKVTEECGEVLQVIGKLMATHGKAQHWDGQDLAARLVEELADLQAAIVFVMGDGTLHGRALFNERYREKLNLFQRWHREQRWPEPPPPLCALCEEDRRKCKAEGLLGFVLCSTCLAARPAQGDPP